MCVCMYFLTCWIIIGRRWSGFGKHLRCEGHFAAIFWLWVKKNVFSHLIVLKASSNNAIVAVVVCVNGGCGERKQLKTSELLCPYLNCDVNVVHIRCLSALSWTDSSLTWHLFKFKIVYTFFFLNRIYFPKSKQSIKNHEDFIRNKEKVHIW